jgi:indole-3-acetate monooxygenase
MSQPESVAAVARDPQEILAAVAALGPMIEEEASATNAGQRMTDRVKDALAEAGAFSIAWPAQGWNGPEMRLEDQVRLIESIAYHDASTAWCVQILADSGYFAPKMDERAAREIYTSIDLATAGSTRPAGRAVKVDGGYRLSGRWSFGSGIHNADVVYCGFHVYDEPDGEPELAANGQPLMQLFFVPRDAVTLYDTWYTTGLAGTGSVDYSVDDVFVPDGWTINVAVDYVADDAPPLSRYPGTIVVNQAGVPLGIARRAIDEFRRVVEKPNRTNPRQSMKVDDPYVPIAYAEAVALYDAARAYTLRVTAEISDVLFSGGELSPRLEGGLMQAGYMAGTLSRQAVEVLLECLGARSVLAAMPFDRLYRDMSTAIRHGSHRRKALEMAGVAMLELEWPVHLAE